MSLRRAVQKLHEKVSIYRETRAVMGRLDSGVRTLGARACSHVPVLMAHLDRVLCEYVRLRCQDIIRDLKLVQGGPGLGVVTDTRTGADTIWFFWWQGRERAPSTVLHCLNQLKQNLAPDQQVIQVDASNYTDYVQLHPDIIEGVTNGRLRLSHFSDILRFALLYAHGGLWVDAGTFATVPLTQHLQRRIVSLRHNDGGRYKSAGRWTGFFFGGAAGEPFFRAMQDSLTRLHRGSGAGIEYLIMDYVIHVLCESDPRTKTAFDDFPVIDFDFREMQRAIASNKPDRNIPVHPINVLTWKLEALNAKALGDLGSTDKHLGACPHPPFPVKCGR